MIFDVTMILFFILEIASQEGFKVRGETATKNTKEEGRRRRRQSQEEEVVKRKSS